MKHLLRQLILGRPPEIPISADDFAAIKDARRVLTEVFSIEESYDLVVSNYIELEQEVLTAAATEVCRDGQSYNDFFELRSTVNRRFVNLLSACRAYIDQTPQALVNCSTSSSLAREQFKSCLSENYNKSFSYRFFEALRNHVQHCGLAVHRVSINSRWTQPPSLRRLEISIEPYASRKYLEEDPKFKKKVLEETPEDVALLGHLRNYMQAIGVAHGTARSSTKDRVLAARECIEAHVRAYAAVNDGVTVGLAAIESQDDKPIYVETIPLLLDWDDVRIRLSKRNSTLGGLAARAVVSRGE